MYDDEAEIRRKRRNLIIGIAAVVGLIILLIIILIALSSKPKKPAVEYKVPTCELIVTNDVQQTSSGAYTGPIVIEVDESKTTVTSGYTITSTRVGITNSARNSKSYKLSKSGVTTIHGYVTDSKGGVGECEKDFEIQTSRPNCQLKVESGTVGEDGWYTSDVVVTFENKSVENGTIEKYSIEEVVKDVETNEVISKAPTENNDRLTIKTDAEVEVMGTVVDNYGVSGTCSLIIKKDAEKPTCSLEVTSGKANDKGIYSDNVVVGFEKAEDSVSGVLSNGVGVKENYTDESYTVKKAGKTKVFGYVKDKAGNTGECEIEINKGNNGESPSTPSCKLLVRAKGKQGNSYKDGVVITFASKGTTNGAEITEYGIATSAQLNNSQELRLDQEGTFTVYGMVKDSNDITAECKATISIVKEKPSEPSCSLFIDATVQPNGTYLKGATVKFRNKTSTNGAEIKEYGIGLDKKLTQNDTFMVGIGTYKVYGMVKDSYGHTAECGPIDFTVVEGTNGGSGKPSGGGGSSSTPTGTLASTVLKQGDIVSYKSYKSVKCENSSDVASKNTWEVFRIKDNSVELITTGIPECFNFGYNVQASNAIASMNSKAKKYINSEYARSARIMTKEDALVYGGAEDLKAGAKRNTGVYYWLATQGTKKTQLYAVRNGGAPSKTGFIFEGSTRTYGIRPIVTLNKDVYAEKNNSGEWVLSTLSKGGENNYESTLYDKIVEIINSTLLAEVVIE
jgi:hypothetical protein